ncbi:MAG TPA: sulfotransferase [Rhizomicrobium sp.]|nr:sulfotransferase [Rhizomicrobium sp.]
MREQTNRHIFVCGLHRSGTSLITRSLAEHPEVTGFQDTGVIEDEGQFLQTVVPLEIAYGGVGRFGFDPRAHLTEVSPLNTQDNARKLLSEWNRHWDDTRRVRIEKTPSNLLRMRLLAELARPCHFIIVTRHPVAACLATLKWTEGNLFSLLSHWVHCYRIARSDALRLRHVIWTSYEAFVADPEGERNRLLAFAGLAPCTGLSSPVKNENEKYFALWRQMYSGDGDRAIAQVPPEHHRSLLTKIRDRIAHDRREKSLPPYRRRANLRHLYDGLDAAAALENAIAEFGYSFHDFDKAPQIGSTGLLSERRDALCK